MVITCAALIHATADTLIIVYKTLGIFNWKYICKYGPLLLQEQSGMTCLVFTVLTLRSNLTPVLLFILFKLWCFPEGKTSCGPGELYAQLSSVVNRTRFEAACLSSQRKSRTWGIVSFKTLCPFIKYCFRLA